MHPFDLRTILFAKHAQHVVVIHFPIALFAASLLFDIAGLIRRSASLAAAAYWNLLAAAASIPPTIATGLLAWRWQLSGKRIRGTLLLHLVLAAIAGLLICGLCWARYRDRAGRDRPQRIRYLLAGSVTLLVVAMAAHLGGILSGVNVEMP